MSKDRGYLQTITCSINLSSCRLRAESLARALNSRLWSTRGLNFRKQRTGACDTYLKADSDNKVSTSSMANVVNQPSRSQMESFQGNLDNQRLIGHGWINEMAAEDSEELFDTPPCSSPPSPVDDPEDIIVNPPTLNRDPLPFTTKFLRDVKYCDAFSNSSKLREKLQQYADGLLSSADDATETFYDASEDDRLAECNQIDNSEQLADKSNFQSQKSISLEIIAKNVADSCQNKTEEVNQKCSCFAEKCSDIRISQSDIEAEVSCCDVTEVQPDSRQSVLKDPDILVTDTEKDPEEKSHKIDNRNIQRVKELEEEERPMLLRTTSLKTGKTPPGTPSRKKIVRFADVLGLDLEAVRHIVCDDLPTVPPSAFVDLKLPPEGIQDMSLSVKPRQQTFNLGSGTWNVSPGGAGSPLSGLVPLFDVPGSNPNFLDRVRADWIGLENITVADLSVHCVCCVLNISYEKSIIARYTSNEWQSYNEVVASYVPFSSNGEFDRFSFSLFLQPNRTQSHERFCFAIRYKTKGAERWDNNRGQDYVLRFQDTEDMSRMLPTLESGSTWLHHFY